jgi:hypothetical protein
MGASSHVEARLRALEPAPVERAGAPPSALGSLSPTAWMPRGELELRDWLEHGRRFGAIGRGVAWWIGDWLLYGNARYGERYARASRATGYDPQSLMNMVYVASRFAVHRRHQALSWSHHAELAALPLPEQERWLELAERERMSVRSLRAELRASRRVERAVEAGAARPAAAPRANVVCPHCSGVIELHGG